MIRPRFLTALFGTLACSGCTASAEDTARVDDRPNLASGSGAAENTLGWAYGDLLAQAGAEYGDEAVVTNVTCEMSSSTGLVTDLSDCFAIGHNEGDYTWLCGDESCEGYGAAVVDGVAEWFVDSPEAVAALNSFAETLTASVGTYGFYYLGLGTAPCESLPEEAPPERALLIFVDSYGDSGIDVYVDGVTGDSCTG